jgi:SAM-dependent methyltransferase
MLTITEAEIREHGLGRNLLALYWRRWRTERALAKRGIRFRATDIDQVVAAYAAMTPAEFAAINALQEWANWRAIPRALNEHVPDRPLRVLDLGCGAGGSTQVLAHYCPPGSYITGFEIAEPMIAIARRREYRHKGGATAHVDFHCQCITDPFSAIPSHTIDLANASGIVGHHLNDSTILPVIGELRRVLAGDGVAILDVGPTMRARALHHHMTDARFTYLGRYRSWFADPRGLMVFRNSSNETQT